MAMVVLLDKTDHLMPNQFSPQITNTINSIADQLNQFFRAAKMGCVLNQRKMPTFSKMPNGCVNNVNKIERL